MEDKTFDQSLLPQVNKRPRRKILLRLLAFTLLLSVALGSYLALEYLAPRAPRGAQGVTTRLSWYLQSGQSRADLRTLASVFRFMMGTESDAGTVNDYSTLPVAEKATSNLPKS